MSILSKKVLLGLRLRSEGEGGSTLMVTFEAFGLRDTLIADCVTGSPFALRVFFWMWPTRIRFDSWAIGS